jgi:hypothetical protein
LSANAAQISAAGGKIILKFMIACDLRTTFCAYLEKSLEFGI